MRLNFTSTVGQPQQLQQRPPEPTAIERLLQRAQSTAFERSTFLPLSEEDRAQLLGEIEAAKGPYLVAAQNPLLTDTDRCVAQKMLAYIDQIVLPGITGARDDFEAALAIEPFSRLNTFPSRRRSTFGPLCNLDVPLTVHKEVYIERLHNILSEVEDALNEPGRGEMARCATHGLLKYAHNKTMPAIEGAATDIEALGAFIGFNVAMELIGKRILAECREKACSTKIRTGALIAGGAVLGLGLIGYFIFRRKV